jgi:two-component system cell cycle sensor histidine kinase/response regulator CckA
METGTKTPAPCWPTLRKRAFLVVLWYGAAAIIWLAASDWLVGNFVQDRSVATRIDVMGDCLFVAASGIMLAWLQRRYFLEILSAWNRLQEYENRWQLVGNHLPKSYVYEFTRDAGGRPCFTYVSAGVEHVHGLKAAEVLQDAGSLFRQLDPARTKEYLAIEAASARNLTDFEMDFQICRPDGEVRQIHARSRPRRLADGQIYWDGFVMDFTERARLEADGAANVARYRSLFENMLNGFAHCRAIFEGDKPMDFLYLDVNPAFRRLTGLENVIGKLGSEVIPGFCQSDPELLAICGRVALTGLPEQCEVYVNGLENWLAISVYCPAKEYFVVVFDVVTERKRAEAALRQSEEQFRAIFELASIGIGQADPYTGRIVCVNRKFSEITGYSNAELLELTVADITHPNHLLRDQELIQSLMQGELSSYQTDKQYVRKDGQFVWVSVNLALIRDAAGQPVNTIATIEDITARRRAVAERMRLSAALEQAAESILITDVAGVIVYVNPAFERITGYSRREAIGQNPRLLKSGRHDAAFYAGMWETLSRGQVWRGHLVNQRKNGSLFEENVTITPVRDASGRIVNYLGIKLDVTREMELEGQIRQSQKLEAIGQLAGGIAHDFNNILTSILMQVELGAMEAGLSDDTCESFRQIRCDAERAADLTRQLLLFSRRQVMQPHDVDLNKIVSNLSKMLNRIIGEDVRLGLELFNRPVLAHADPGMLEQVVMNLAVNARDAMPGGGFLRIATSAQLVNKAMAEGQPDAVPGQYVCLSVTDTGCGIPEEILPRIYEPFFTTKAPGEGTGLGLATVFGIVKQHRGWIAVDTRVGCGTTFRIYLPAITAAAQLPHAPCRSKPLGGTETVLLAEDDATVRLSIRTVLARSGYDVLEASDGDGAVKLWAESGGKASLLLTDLVMPGGMTGQELAHRLRAEKPALKVIYTSGYSAEIAGRQVRLQTGESFVPKPVSPDTLLNTVRQCLDA